MEQQWLPSTHWRRIHGKGLANDPLAHLAAPEKSKLVELQRTLQAEGAWSAEHHDPYALRRFLKAREWDVQRAKQMWLEMLAFRANNRVDYIFQEFQFTEKDRVLAAYPHGLHKVDREGRPVLVYKFGAVDLDALLQMTNMQRLTQWHIQEYERIMRAVLPACSVRAGAHIEKIVSIIDVAGVRMRDIGRVLELLSTYIKVDSNNYPETLGAMIIINAPMWFSGSFGLVKRMLSAETQKKMQILGSSYQSALQAVIAPENLLREFGGTSIGNLGDSIGPWTPVLEQMRAVEAAAESAHQAQMVKAAGELDRKRSVEAARKSQEGLQQVGAAGPRQGPATIVLHPPEYAPHDTATAHAGQKHRLDQEADQQHLPSRRSMQQSVQQAGPMQVAPQGLVQRPHGQQGQPIMQQQGHMPHDAHMQGSSPVQGQLGHIQDAHTVLQTRISSGGSQPTQLMLQQQQQQHQPQQGIGIHSHGSGTVPSSTGHLQTAGSLPKPLSPRHSYKEALQSHSHPQPHTHGHPHPIPGGSSVHDPAHPSFVSSVTPASHAQSGMLESYMSATEASSMYMSGELTSMPFLVGTHGQMPVATPIAASVPPVPVDEQATHAHTLTGWQQQQQQVTAGHQQPQSLLPTGHEAAHGTSPGSSADAGVHAVLIPARHAGADPSDAEILLAKGGAVTDGEDDDGARSLVSFASCRSIDSVTGLSNGPASPRSTASKRLRYSGSGKLKAQASVDKEPQLASSWQPTLPHVQSVQSMPQEQETPQQPVSNAIMTSRAAAVAVAAASKVMSALTHRMPRWFSTRAGSNYERLEDQPPQQSPLIAVGSGNGSLAPTQHPGERRKAGSGATSFDLPHAPASGSKTMAAGGNMQAGSTQASHARAGSPPRPGAQQQPPSAALPSQAQWPSPHPDTGTYSVDAETAADRLGGLPAQGSITAQGVFEGTGQHVRGPPPAAVVRDNNAQSQLPYSVGGEELETANPTVSPFTAAVPPTGGRYSTQLVPEYVRAWLRTAAGSFKHGHTGSRQQLLDTHEGSAVVDHAGSYDVDADPFFASIGSPLDEPQLPSQAGIAAGLRRASEPNVTVSPAAELRRSGSGHPHVRGSGFVLPNRESASLMNSIIPSDSGWSLDPPAQQAMSPPNHFPHWEHQRMQATIETTLQPSAETQPPPIRGMHARSRSGGRGIPNGTLEGAAPKPNGRPPRNGRRLPVAYEVYVDSDDEEEGGLLHVGGARPLLPRYGLVRRWTRRLFCCCRPL